jgi:hypothetical protein
MNNSDIVACIYKHIGGADDLENLTDMAKEIAMMSANEMREACARVCDDVASECDHWDEGGQDGRTAAQLCSARILGGR